MSEGLPPAASATSARARGCDRWLLGALLLVGAGHGAFFALDHPNFGYDDSWYAECTNRLLDAWSGEGLASAYDYFMRIALGGQKSPFILLPALPLVLLLGRVELAYVLASVAGWLLASVYLYRLIARFAEPRLAAAGVLLFSLMPLTVDMTRQFYVETWMTALAAMFVFHYTESAGFTHRRHALLAGVAGGLGLLAKVTFPIYVVGLIAADGLAWLLRDRARLGAAAGAVLIGAVGPVAALAAAQFLAPGWSLLGGGGVTAILLLGARIRAARRARGMREAGSADGAWRCNLALSAALGLWIGLPWYAYNGGKIFGFALSAAVGKLSLDYGDRDYLSLASIGRYWLSSVNAGVGVVSVAALAVALVAALLGSFVRRCDYSGRGWWRGVGVAAAWVIPALVVCTLVRNRTTRYLLPALPGLALLAALLWQHVWLRSRMLAGGLAGLSVVGAGAAFVLFSFTSQHVAWGELVLADAALTTEGPPERAAIPLRDVVHVSMRALPAQPWGRQPLVMLLSETRWVNQNSLTFKASCLRAPVVFGMTSFGLPVEAAIADLGRADALMVIEGGDARAYSEFVNKNGREALARIRDGRLGGWRLREDLVVPLPDGAVARFFERESP